MNSQTSAQIAGIEVSRSARGWRWVAVVALLAYMLVGTLQMHLPGAYYDEALDAVPAMQILLGQRPETQATIHLAGRDWPLMLMPYVGSTTTYLSLVAFGLLGPSVAALRLMNWLLGLASLLLTWGFLRNYLDERIAALSMLLLALNANFVFWSRMGAFVSLPMLPLAIGALWCLYRWYHRNDGRFLMLAALLLGLGVTTKLLFFWYWVGLGLGWLALSPFLRRGRGWRAWLWPWELTTWRSRILSFLALLVGLAPLLIYNLRGLETLHFVLDTFKGESARTGGVLVEMLAAIQRDFGRFLNGSWFGVRLGAVHVDRLAVLAFLAALVTLVGLGLAHKLSFSGRRLALLAILLFSIVAQSALTSMGRGADHLLIAWPIPQALVATAIFALVDAAGTRRWLALLPGLAALCLVGSTAWTTAQYHRSLAQSGGGGFFSDAIYSLAGDLEGAGERRIVALDWGFARNLQLLTHDDLKPAEWFAYGPPGEETEASLNNLVVQPGLFYLLHAPRFTAFPGHRELFEKVAYRHGLAPVVLKSYNQRDGEPVFQVYTLEPAPPLTELPAEAQPLSAALGDGLRLLGYDLPAGPVAPGETLQATLYWQAAAPQDHGYKVFAHLVDDAGKLWAQHDAVPRAWGYPTTQWKAGEIVADRIWLPVPADAPPGAYHLFVGMVDEATGQRLPIALDGQPQPGDTLGLADVAVAR